MHKCKWEHDPLIMPVEDLDDEARIKVDEALSRTKPAYSVSLDDSGVDDR